MDELDKPTRVMIMVSRHYHCLRELSAALRRGELNMTISATVPPQRIKA